MTGPEHYQEAERLIELARDEAKGQGIGETGLERAIERGLRRDPLLYAGKETPDRAALILADAQVHATLALAAATALGTSHAETRAWDDAAGTRLGADGS